MGKNEIRVNYDNLPQVLRDLIEQQGTTRKAVSAKAGVSPNVVTNWLLGYNEPTLDRLCWVLEALDKELAIVDKQPKKQKVSY